MNKPQRIVLILYCLLVVYCCVRVPLCGMESGYRFLAGYGWIWTAPTSLTPDLSIIGLVSWPLLHSQERALLRHGNNTHRFRTCGVRGRTESFHVLVGTQIGLV